MDDAQQPAVLAEAQLPAVAPAPDPARRWRLRGLAGDRVEHAVVASKRRVAKHAARCPSALPEAHQSPVRLQHLQLPPPVGIEPRVQARLECVAPAGPERGGPAAGAGVVPREDQLERHAGQHRRGRPVQREVGVDGTVELRAAGHVHGIAGRLLQARARHARRFGRHAVGRRPRCCGAGTADEEVAHAGGRAQQARNERGDRAGPALQARARRPGRHANATRSCAARMQRRDRCDQPLQAPDAHQVPARPCAHRPSPNPQARGRGACAPLLRRTRCRVSGAPG